MKPSFGARLRLQREKRGVALGDISNQTKIKLSLLEAIERDDLSFWPRGLFGRAYIRAYAEAIGLEMEAAETMNRISVGVIRAVCDYGDEHKNKEWQPYAAAMAAAYAKAILSEIPPRAEPNKLVAPLNG